MNALRTHLPGLAALATAACALAPPDAPEPDPRRLPHRASLTRGLEERPGLFPTWIDRAAGRIWLALPPPDERGIHAECLYLVGLTRGLGSNPVGLDRGKMLGPWVVRFRRAGPRVLLEQPNLGYRAAGAPPAEVAAVEESFASSVLWAGDVAGEEDDGGVLVDLTSLVVRDASGVARTLSNSGQGSWSLDRDRSALEPGGCLAFPDNLELEALVTFTSGDPGGEVRATAPDPESVTLVQHHSFVRLPDDGYRPRVWDPRSGANPSAHRDYAAGLDEPVERRFASRHRLRREDPSDPRSPVVEPIVYHVDRGAPEPVRSALLDGARWWSAAFEAAGYEDAYRVELLPEGVHPLDARYNVIQWVHRATRGWSYGNSLTDPRTGEIVKGHVTLGSLRVRQDRLLFEGLLGAAGTGSGRPDDPVQLALARIRQLSAHEVGHTLGLAHNFTASTYLDRASVMDYPAPLVTVDDGGELDTSAAYGVGVGAWDVVAIQWLYGDWGLGGPEQEQAELDALLAGAQERGIRYHSDADARPPGASQPYANLWDNFADPVTGLENALAVRRVALARFGGANLEPGAPRARLEEVLVPVYFHHRYQLEAAVKAVGGVDYEHLRNDEGGAASPAVPGEMQRRALALVLACLAPEELDLSEDLLVRLAPRAPGLGVHRELFQGETGATFDALGAAATAARLVVDGLLQPERAKRLVDQHRRDPDLPSLEEVLEALTDAAFAGPPEADPRRREIERAVQSVVVEGLLRRAAGASTPGAVRERLEGRLFRLVEEPWTGVAESEADAAHARALVAEVRRFLERESPSERLLAPASDPPPGSPIGADPGACSFESATHLR